MPGKAGNVAGGAGGAAGGAGGGGDARAQRGAVGHRTETPRGAQVIASVAEHNSVLRPLCHLRKWRRDLMKTFTVFENCSKLPQG